MKKLLRKYGFTLVELVVVIVILAILAAMSFMLISKWIGKSKNTKVTGDLSTINLGFQLATTSNKKFPIPGNNVEIKSQDGNILWYQGVLSTTGSLDYLNKIPTNIDGKPYGYSLSQDGLKYQFKGYNLEETFLTDSAYAIDYKNILEGNYNGYIVALSGSNKYLWNTTSLFISGAQLKDTQDMQLYENTKTGLVTKRLKNIEISGLFDTIKTNDCENLDKIMYKFNDEIKTRQFAAVILKDSALTKGLQNSCATDSNGGYIDLDYISTLDLTKQTNKDMLSSLLYGTNTEYTRNWYGTGCSNINYVELLTGGTRAGSVLNAENTVYILKDKTTNYTFTSAIELKKCSSIIGKATLTTSTNYNLSGFINLVGNNIIDGITLDNNNINNIGVRGVGSNLTINRLTNTKSKVEGVLMEGTSHTILNNSILTDNVGNGITIRNSSSIELLSTTISKGTKGLNLFNISESKIDGVKVDHTTNEGLYMDTSLGNNIKNSMFTTGSQDGVKIANGSTNNIFDLNRTSYNTSRGVNLSGVCGNTIRNHISSYNGIQVSNGIKNTGGCNVLENISSENGVDASGVCGSAVGNYYITAEAITGALRCGLGAGSSVTEGLTGYDWTCKNGNSLEVSCSAKKLIVDATKENQVAAGNNFICTILTGGNDVYCWGNNYYGSLGNGNNENSNFPVKISGLTNVKQLATFGNSNTICALKNDGTVYCWGINNVGQVGNNTIIDTNIPVQVSGLTNVNKIAASNGHICALKNDNTLSCWGTNSYKQLGDGTTTQRNSPVSSFTGYRGAIKDISLGNAFTCILKTDNTLWCGGANTVGQIGNGIITTGIQPIIQILSNVKSVSIGVNYSCVIKNDDTLWCWGGNNYGKLGVGDGVVHSSPTQVSAIGTVNSVVLGSNSTCAVKKSDGELYCWGYGYYYKNQFINSNIPEKTSLISSSDLKNYFIGNTFTLVLNKNGSFNVVGTNSFGQVGNGKNYIYTSPTNMDLVPEKKFQSIKYWQTTYFDTNGDIYRRGDNIYGQIGDGTYDDKMDFTKVVGLQNVVKLDTINNTTMLAITSDNKIYGWGRDYYAQLGLGTTNLTGYSTPQFITGDFKEVSSSNAHTCGVKLDGTVYCWGANNTGQIGNNNLTRTTTPTKTLYLTDVNYLSSCAHSTCAVKNDKTLWCWGRDIYGSIGSGDSAVNMKYPTYIMNDVIDIQSSNNYTRYVLKSDGSLRSWGYNIYGQIGDGTTTTRFIPQKIINSGVKKIGRAYGNTVCVLKTDSTVRCWGTNNAGQIGNGTTIQANIPTQVVGLSNVIDLYISSAISCAIKNDGSKWCWGNISNPWYFGTK